MKLTFHNAKFTSQEDRQRLANRLARIIAALDGIDFEPYKVVPFDSMAWVLDQNNDWRLTFSLDDDTTAEIRYRYQGPGADHEGALAAWLCHAIGATVAQQTAVSGPASPTSQQTGVDSSVMVEALNAWASDLERGMQVCIYASSLRKIAAALAAPQPAQQPDADKLLRKALEALDHIQRCIGFGTATIHYQSWTWQHSEDAIVAIRKHLGDA